MQADKAPHPFAQLSIVLTQESRYMRWSHLGDFHVPKVLWRKRKPDQHRFYIRHWPVPNLQPRLVDRGDKFENIAYFGVAHSLSSRFRSQEWQDQLKELGFNWIWRRGKQINDWNDYRTIDAVISIRESNTQDFAVQQWASKPPTKLINAWLAGVPAIMGPETSLREVRISEYDYVEVASCEEAIAALLKLREDHLLRAKILDACTQRGQENSAEQTLKDWIAFLQFAEKYHAQWMNKSFLERQLFWLDRWLRLVTDLVLRFLFFRREGITKRINALRNYSQAMMPKSQKT